MLYKHIKLDRADFKVQYFSNIYDFTTYLDQSKVSNIFKCEDLSSQDYGSWHGTNTYNEAQELLSHGWLPEASALSKKLPISSTLSPASKRTNIYSVAGFQASVPRYLQGVPTNMISQRKSVQKQKVVVLNRSIVFSASWSAKKIEEEGIKALQVVKALEGNGFRVKLNVMTVHTIGYGKTESAVAVICVKKPDEPLNLSKIAFPIAHPAMLRRLAFKWLENFQEITNRSFTSGYGSAREDLYKNIMPKGEHLMPSEIGDVEKYIKTLI